MQCDEQSSNSVETCTEEVVGDNSNEEVVSVEEIPPRDTKILLTQLWEHVVKYNKLPDNLDAEVFFSQITQRLRNPEWEVRQHSLRVLVNIIPVIKTDDLDAYVEETLNEIVRNLGHIGPAVRKAAIDALRTYVNYTKKPNLIIRELVQKGVEKGPLNKVNPNITLGIITAIPFLISSKISIDALRYVIHVLLEKLENILHQENIIRSLLRIKGIVGNRRFEEILEAHKSKKDFEMLCELYSLPEPTICDFIPDAYETKQVWSDYNQNLVDPKTEAKVEEVSSKKLVDTDKVILETEIKLDKGPAITMKIHEESKENSFFDSSDSDCENRGIATFQVLADDSDDDFESLRKTPRRVRFGGEIVKMRTPDSDSNHPSDDAEDKQTLNTKSKSTLDFHYKKTTKLFNKSHIPIPVSSRNRPNSEPNSPKKVKSAKLYKSSPNLSEECDRKSRIPKKADYSKKQTSKSINNKVNNVSKNNTKREEHPRKMAKFSKKAELRKVESKVETKDIFPALEYKPSKEKQDQNDEQKPNTYRNLSPPRKINRNLERFSPIPVHNEIEVFHNLTRSPERKSKKSNGDPSLEECRLTTADDVLLDQMANINERKIHTAETGKVSTANQVVFINNYNSFHVYNSNGNNRLDDFDSSIPTRDTGECLTCSSSGSDATSDKVVCECIGLVDERILHDIQARNDIATKKRGLEELLKALKEPNSLDSIEEKLPFLLNILFNAEQHPILQSISEQNLSYIFGTLTEEVLMDKMQTIVYNLSKTGSPVGVRLALIVLKRVQAKQLVDCLLSDCILGAKSSKIREGALQILMTISRIFPSTEMDIPKCLTSVIKMLTDKKRKVRQAALETIASLTQLSSTSIVFDVATKIVQNHPDKDHLLRVIRARLSRKQLPAVDLSGNVRYSTPLGHTEVEFLSNTTNGRLEEQIDEGCHERRLESSSEEKTNYWIQKEPNTEGNEIMLDDNGWNSHEHRDESLKNLHTQIWALDPGTIYPCSDKVNQVNGTLRPVFVIQPDSSQSCESLCNGTTRSHKQTNTDHADFRPTRGRSFSPPKKPYDSSTENGRFYKTNGTRNTFYNHEKFQKSFSSDQLVPSSKGYIGHSESSSTSGSSMRSNGAWRKDVRSGIPVPINTDNRFKFRTKQNEFKGPITTQYYNSKLQNTEPTPDRLSAQTRPVMATQPFSSGSESSGYFTPPAEPHLPDIFDQSTDAASRLKSSQSERFVRVGTPSIHHENFTIIDSNYCESLKSKSAPVQHYPSFDSVDFEPPKEFGEVVERVSSAEEEEEEEKSKESIEEGQVVEEYQEKILRRESTVTSLEDLDFIANQSFGERKLLSKSEADIIATTERIRKTVSSAPTTNKTYEHFKTFDDTPISSTKTSLPGSIVDFQEIEVVQEVIEKSPTKTICTKKITRQLSRKRSIKTMKQPEEHVSTPFTKPKESLTETLNQLDSSEWEVTMRGLQNLFRLVRHHRTMVESNLHAICVGLGKHIKNLRSQVARNACSAASELFKTCKKAMEVEIEELATPLLHRTADTNKFLRSDANTALDDMSANLSPPKVVGVVTSKGSTHQNAIVRCTSVRLLCALCHRLGPEKTFQLPKDTRDKILVTGANMLTEGSLETRKYAKMLLSHLSGHSQFHKAMMEAVPSHIMRHISKSLKALT